MVRREAVSAGIGLQLHFVSDLHLAGRWTERIVDQVLAVAAEDAADLVLLGGDLVDRRSTLPQLARLVSGLVESGTTVLAVPGNHDRLTGLENVRQTVIDAGGSWLPDAGYRRDGLEVIAPGSSFADDEAFRILCAHYPKAVSDLPPGGCDLVLAGHLHGCQWVLWERGGEFFPGAWFYRWNGTRYLVGDTALIVSRGVNDTFPLRWKCPREVVVCAL